MDTAQAVYSTSTGQKSDYSNLPEELQYELGLTVFPESDFDPFWDESDLYDEWCHVCSRPTDHRGEHDDLVEEGRARYDERLAIVYSY